ncbi:MAG: BrnT family toxin [Saprospiraceae bacterium]|nr:BrnT family toxin [Saprospiraceae bacterium]
MAKYEWDQKKDELNRDKHRISFNRAKEVFEDPFRIEYPGTPNSSNENRAVTVGKVMGRFLIAVVYTLRDTVYRIISARQARNSEIKDYIRKKFEQFEDD